MLFSHKLAQDILNEREHSFRRTRSRRLYTVLNYNYLIFPTTLGIFFYRTPSLPYQKQFFPVWVTVADHSNKKVLYQLTRITGYYAYLVTDNAPWTVETVALFVCSLASLIAQLPPYACVWGMCLPIRPFGDAQRPKSCTFRTLSVCLVTKGTNFQVLPHTFERENPY
jgi:hypothetical protein